MTILPLLAEPAITWVKVPRPTFDLVGVVLSSLGLAGIWVALGLWLAARAALLGRRWQAQFGLPAAS